MGDIGKLRAHWTSSAPVRGNFADRSPESVAEVLRNARLLQGYSLSEVAGILHIREAHLDAIEEGRFSELPPLVYAQGFVASYAGFLQLDRSEMVARFKDEASASPKVQMAAERLSLPSFAEPENSDHRMAPSGLMLATAFTVLLLAYGAWSMMSNSGPSVDVLNVPPLPERFLQAPPALPTVTLPPAAPVPEAQPAPLVSLVTGATLAPAAKAPVYVMPVQTGASDHIITLRASGETWVQLRNEAGQRVASFVLKAGEGYTLPAGANRYSMTTGNLALINIAVDGQPVAHPRSGRELVLDADALRGTSR